MKKTIFMLVLLATMYATAQELQVYSINGTAERQVGAQWKSLVLGEILKGNDRVRTSARGSITLLDIKRRKVYAVQSEEGGRLESLVGSQRAKAQSLSREAFAEVVKSIFTRQDNRFATRGGVTYRGGNADEMIAAWLRQNLSKDFKVAHSEYRVSLQLLEPFTNKKLDNIKINGRAEVLAANESSDALYVNLIDVDAKGNWSAMGFDNQLIPPHSAVLLSHPIEFFEPRGTDHIILIAYPEEFNIERIIELYHTSTEKATSEVGVAVQTITIE